MPGVATSDIETPETEFRAPRMPAGVVIVVSVLLTWFVIIAVGYGEPTALFIIGGAALAWSGNWLLERFGAYNRRRWLAELGLFAAVGGVMAGLAVISSHPGADAACRQIFGVRVPPGVRIVEARKQFSDGFDWILRFEADEQGFAALCSPRAFAPDPEEMRLYEDGSIAWDGLWRRSFEFAFLCDPAWRDPPVMTRPKLLKWQADSPTGDETESAVVMWDAATGQGYALYSVN